jgi:hypothetical protein
MDDDKHGIRRNFIEHSQSRIMKAIHRHPQYEGEIIEVVFFQLVPLTGWLPVPLPSQIRCMTVPGGPITSFEVSPCKQLLIIARKTGDPQLWHIMSNRIIGTFKGKMDFHQSRQ